MKNNNQILDSMLIETFLVIVEQGAITRAADVMLLSQSTVSYRLNVLEKELHTVLIDRNRGNHTLGLTERGKEFYKLAKEWSELNSKIANFANEKVELKELRLVAPESIIKSLYKLFSYMQEENPKLSFVISTANSNQIAQMLTYDKADIGFSYIKDSNRKFAIKSELLESVPLVLVIKRENLNQDVLLEDLNVANQILISGITYQNDIIQKWIQEKIGKSESKTLVVDNISVLKSLAFPGAWFIVTKAYAEGFDDFEYQKIVLNDIKASCYMLYKYENITKLRSVLKAVYKIQER